VIAALFVEASGCYAGLPGVDLWPVERDARKYPGPGPVLAHPPCPRWGRMAALVESLGGAKRREDGGCFASALNSVRSWGGVLEHPAVSDAWRAFLLPEPPISGGWVGGICGGYACHVEQGNYGHRAPKPTWLYFHPGQNGWRGALLPSLKWGPSGAVMRVGLPKSRKGERGVEIPKRERIATPLPFRDLMLELARLVVAAPHTRPTASHDPEGPYAPLRLHEGSTMEVSC